MMFHHASSKTPNVHTNHEAVDAPSDRALMAGVERGEEAALETLFNRYRRPVYAVCLRVLRNESDAEDTLIDVFMEVWQRPQRFNAKRGTVWTYLMVLARSRAIDRVRSRAARARPLGAEDVGDCALPGDDAQNPAELCSLNERRRQVRRALAVLPSAQRKAVDHAFFGGLSHREIAEQQGVPLGTVKTRIRLGLIRFRDALCRIDEFSADRAGATAEATPIAG